MNELTVLLVEDNEGDALLTEELLNQAAGIKMKLYVAKDGTEAIDCILKRDKYTHAGTPDFVVLDINLPKIDGKEVLTFIKGNELYQSLPVIMYTSSESETDMLFCYKKGADLYLSKANTEAEAELVVTAFKKFVALSALK